LQRSGPKPHGGGRFRQTGGGKKKQKKLVQPSVQVSARKRAGRTRRLVKKGNRFKRGKLAAAKVKKIERTSQGECPTKGPTKGWEKIKGQTPLKKKKKNDEEGGGVLRPCLSRRPRRNLEKKRCTTLKL